MTVTGYRSIYDNAMLATLDTAVSNLVTVTGYLYSCIIKEVYHVCGSRVQAAHASHTAVPTSSLR